MKNSKGFTLIEVLGAIIILGIIAIIGFNTFTSSLRGFREDYYTEISRSLENSGQEFFNDNRNYRPSQILGAQKVSISALETKEYTETIVDYNGDKCENSSYVLIVKEGRNDYSYHTCLVCSEDNYDNTSDEYCDSAWLDSTTITYGIGDVPTLYVYKGTSRDEVKEKLELPVSYIRKNSKGEVIRSVRGTGEDNLPTILPTDIDTVDTNKIGTYKIHYEFKQITNGREDETIEKKEGKVVVYENNAPNLNITYRDIVAKQGATLANVRNNVTEEKTGNYVSGEWHQDITIKLSPPNIIEPDVTPSRYQWKKADGKWVDFCTTTSSCTKTLTSDMNETVEFRMIDTNGKISKLTNPIIIRRDKTKPRCNIQDYGTKGDDDWYRSDVDVKFTVNEDVNSTYTGAISGVKLNNLDVQTAIINRNQDRKTNKHTTDTRSVTYIGYVEDRANNFNTCSVTFKRDVTPPTCELQTSGTLGLNNWFVSNVGVSFKTASDATSDVRRYGIHNDSGVHSLTHTDDTASVTYNGYIRDIAGNTNSCSITFKKDATRPSCTMKISGTIGDNNWYTSNVKVEFNSTGDNLSGVYQYGVGDYTSDRIVTHTADIASKTYTGYIKDYAGNTNTCVTQEFKKDGTKPICSLKLSGTKGLNDWYTTNVGVTFDTNTDAMSGVYQYGIESYTGDRSITHTADIATKTYTGYIKDNAGNTNTCAQTFKKDATKPSCTMKISGTIGDNSWYTSNVKVEFASTNDNLSGVYQYGVGGYTNDRIVNHTVDIASKSYTGYVKDNAGNTNTCVTDTFKKDGTKPTCTMKISGTKGDNSWYTSNVKVEFASTSDNLSTVSTYGIGDYTGNKTVDHTADISSKTYTGYVKDKAGNTNTCVTETFKKDGTKPSCSLKLAGTVGDNSWYISNVKVEFDTATDATSNVASYGIGSYTGNKSATQTSDTDGITYTGYIKDNAGNTNTCTKSFKRDATKPSCSINQNPTAETKSSVTLTISGSDGMSKMGSYSWTSSTSGFSSTTTKAVPINGTYYGYTKDNAGNVQSCSKTVTNIVLCDPGYYRGSDGYCKKCDAGYYCPGKGESPCGPGTYSNAGASSCTPCESGTYNTTSGNSSCATCPKGKYCTGGQNVTDCSAGTFRNTTGGKKSTDCTACATGSYSSSGAEGCTACQNGTTTSGTGKTTCDATCSNASNVSGWNAASWSNNSVSNLCSISSCITGYEISGSICKKSGVATSNNGSYIGTNSSATVEVELGTHLGSMGHTPTATNGSVTCTYSATKATCTVTGMTATEANSHDTCAYAVGGDAVYYNNHCYARAGSSPGFNGNGFNCGTKDKPRVPGKDHHCPEYASNGHRHCSSSSNDCITAVKTDKGTGSYEYKCLCWSSKGTTKQYYTTVVTVSYYVSG